MAELKKYKQHITFLFFSVILIVISGCTTTKKKGEVSKFKKFYHNMTSKYNGYFNANELYKEAMITMRNEHHDNYNQILSVYDYVDVKDPKIIAADMDLAIEKVTTVASLHEVGDWVDDCYVMMGKAQFLKQDYERAEETLLYFQDQFNPINPYGRNYRKKKLSAKDKKKLREQEQKEKIKVREEERKKKEEEREAAREKAEEEKKRKEEEKKKKAEDRKKERERKKKERERARKDRKKKKRNSRKKKSDKNEEKSSEQDTDGKGKEEESIKKKSDDEAVIPVVPEPTEEKKVETKIDEATGEEVEIDLEERIKEMKANEPKDETSYNEGLLLLAMTQIERANYFSADFILKRLEDTNYLKDEVRRAINPVKARLYMAQKRYDEAIPYLVASIETADRKQDKARYSFIIGQIYQQRRNFEGANTYFNKAKVYSKGFEMGFMSLLNVYKTSLLSGKESRESITKKIEKLAKERKYEEFKDQIYYTLGDLALEDNNEKLALEYFQKSNSFNSGNDPLKTEAYYRLAKMFFAKEKYLESKLYFDSTLTVISKKDVRLEESEKYVANLEGIAKNLGIIEFQDSLLYLSTLSKDELVIVAKKIKEYEEKNGLVKKDEDLKSGKLFTKDIKKGNYTRSSFFAYNLSMKEQGKVQFEQKWGDRPLEDNWRRSSKEINEGSEIEEQQDIVSNETEDDLSEAEFNRIMRDVPFKVKQKESSNQKIKQALFDLGKLYRDKLNNYKKSIAALEELNERYPNNMFQLDAFYYLFLSHNDLGQKDKAEHYKSLILVKFPDSQYAQLISDPEYGKKLLDERNKEEKLYKATYALFEKGRHNDVIKNVTLAEKQIDQTNEYMPKFLLLKAMSTGSLEGKDEYILGLQAVITRFPNTEEERRAKEILRFLKGDSNAFSNVSVEEANRIFRRDDERKHHVAAMVLNTEGLQFQEAKISVSNYNKKYFKPDNLQLGEFTLSRDKNIQIILVRSFKNKDKAMEYFNDVEGRRDEFISPSIADYVLFPITQTNFTRLIKQKEYQSYGVWFEENYLK